MRAGLCVVPQNLAEFYATVTNPRRVTQAKSTTEALDAIDDLLALSPTWADAARGDSRPAWLWRACAARLGLPRSSRIMDVTEDCLELTSV